MDKEEYLKKKYPNYSPRRLSFSYKEVVEMLDEFTKVQQSQPQGEEKANMFSVEQVSEKVKEAYTDGFSDSRFDFDAENYL